MKKIINMKRYDSKKSELVSTWSNGGHRSDFWHCTESLYRTSGGNWFLHGEGGPLTRFACACEGGRMTTDGEDIVPITEDEVAAWLAEHDVEACERHFPKKLQDA